MNRMLRFLSDNWRYWMMATALLTVLSCKEVSPSLESLEATEKGDVTTVITGSNFESNILSFKDWDAFDTALLMLGKASQAQSEAWDQNHKFVSLSSVYNKVLSEQDEILDRLEGTMKNTAYLSVQSPKELIELAGKYNGSIVVGDYGLELGLFTPAYARLINKDRMVIVGSTLVQYTKEGAKSMPYAGNLSIVSLKSASRTDESQKIYVNKSVKYGDKKSRQARGISYCDSYNPNGSLQLL
ncbi:MAG: hypothetical protein EAZ91_25625 [Cytophagales bacterium]|nr:MAG: hypothetical protein EAZ91_25625 [Cytophagales bacterium]